MRGDFTGVFVILQADDQRSLGIIQLQIIRDTL